MKRCLLAALAVLSATACATASKITIADRLENLGLSRDRSECMANELDDRLNDDQLSKFARFTVQLDKADSALQAISALRQIEDPKIARAVTGSAFSCALN
ncbi:hypothetical protein HK107_10355 [Parvularcula sp. ZS-1/3]|uniref:Lipoprotein n=1 Tax=Parvularcula mediterranea TaxID=2732508 RepID=A0A7Y3RMA5_9PROT|nr:hypothetical protein [Parvularcula mediterranea]NNU16723.1 hypothetical protein [Parvularcula mediterranea]